MNAIPPAERVQGRAVPHRHASPAPVFRFADRIGFRFFSDSRESWLGDQDSNLGCSVQSRVFYR